VEDDRLGAGAGQLVLDDHVSPRDQDAHVRLGAGVLPA
jgi:hypothetical protein